MMRGREVLVLRMKVCSRYAIAMKKCGATGAQLRHSCCAEKTQRRRSVFCTKYRPRVTQGNGGVGQLKFLFNEWYDEVILKSF